MGCTFESIDKSALSSALNADKISPIARRAIELRLDGAHAAANKFRTMLAWRNDDGRVRDADGTRPPTGRWSSHGIQLQYSKAPIGRRSRRGDRSRRNRRHRDLARTYSYRWPSSATSHEQRSWPRRVISCSPRTTAALKRTRVARREMRELRQWAKFDETHDPTDEPYVITGKPWGWAEIKAKLQRLRSDTWGGARRLLAFLHRNDTASDEEIKRRQKAWRAGHPATVKFWGILTARRSPPCRTRWLPVSIPFRDPTGEFAVVFKELASRAMGRLPKRARAPTAALGRKIALQAASRDRPVAAMPRLEKGRISDRFTCSR